MRKSSLLLVLAFGFAMVLLSFGATSADPGSSWAKTYGGERRDEAYSIIQTSDGGYALAGYTQTGTFEPWDFWLVKTDSSGNMQWNKTFGGGSNNEVVHSIIQTSDGGYALAGYTYSYGAGGNDFWLVKTDSSGNEQWNKTFGGENGDSAYSVIQTSDGGYALAGYTYSYGAGNGDSWLVKTDSSGNMQWNKTFGGENGDAAYSAIQTSDGGYALAGDTMSYGASWWDFWLVKTDSSGNMQWNKTFGGGSRDDAWSVIQTSDGGYALVGYTGSYGAGDVDFWLVKVDSSGNEQWSKAFGGTDSDDARSLIQTSDGGYALAGLTQSYGAGGADFWLVKTDSLGNEQWNKTFGGTDSDVPKSLIQTSDGGYALAGYTISYGAGGLDLLLVKTDSSGNVEWPPTPGDTNGGDGSPGNGDTGGGIPITYIAVGAVIGVVVVLVLILKRRGGTAEEESWIKEE